ncbi:sodium-dependent phosphate transport protein 4 isoform X4 [Dasypus novemcinctus]|uniref:sodium-dependent phosphate transport protein 4 isoform X4 n=1 Tax=Dasypus novemcinctus TaxID=9361 RepID=UPI00265E7A63|nr:sodium-dependent phosphate transport protein 4 isoform X3 [Dasypus novemcinctus]
MATTAEASPTTGKSNYTQDLQMDEKHIPRKVPSFCSVRYGVAYVTQLCNFTLIAHNVIINITMIAMVNGTDHQSQVNGSTERLPIDLSGDLNKAPEKLPAGAPVYNWSPQIQGLIFSAVNYGMVLTPAPSGYLAGRIGAKRVVGAALFGSSFLVLCTPLAAEFGVVYLIITRTVQGISQGSGLGGQFALWEKWGPPHERNRLCTIALSGMTLATFITIFLGGFISQTYGWPFVFYIFGGIGCVCSFLWFVLVYDDPVSHPWISISEKEYIVSSLAQQNGILSAIPFIASWVFGLLGGQVADLLLIKGVRLGTVRKITTLLGNLPSSVLLVALPYLKSSYMATVALLTASCGLAPLTQSGVYINALDIAPRYSSFLFGISRGFAQIAAVLAPIVSGYLLNQDPEFGWRNVFLLLFAINILGLIFYLIFGEADIQDWAKERKLTRL